MHMRYQHRKRVVVTGMGMVTPLGLDVSSTWQAVLAGQSGVSHITRCDVSAMPTRIAASIQHFEPAPHLTPRESRTLGVFIQYAVKAAAEALADAGLEVNESNADRIGTCVGSGIGGLPNIEDSKQHLIDKGHKGVSPFFVPGAIINLSTGYISIKYGLRGPNLSVVTACASGTHAIATAARHIIHGDADVMVAGGTEMAICPLGVAGFGALRALSKNNDHPEQASRPWDRDRDGFVLGDGAGILILESEEHALARGATIYAELAGCGFSGDAHHMTAPDPDAKGSANCMSQALKDANLDPKDVHYINAHATSTKAGDLAEVIAIKQVFGEHAQRLAISSTKSMLGHALGASGAIEAALCVLALRDQIAPPTINLDHPDEGCDLDFVPHHARQMPMEVCLSNSLGFGGTNGSLVFKK